MSLKGQKKDRKWVEYHKATLIVSIIAFIIAQTTSKVVKLEITPKTYRDRRCHFLTKFWSKEDHTNLKGSLKIQKIEFLEHPKSDLSLMLKVLVMGPSGSNVIKKLQIQDKTPQFCHIVHGFAKRILDLEIPLSDNKQVSASTQIVSQVHKLPHEYNIYLCDCQKDLDIDQQSYLKNIKISAKIELLDGSVDHHGAESRWIPLLTTTFWVLYTTLFLTAVYKMRAHKAKYSTYDQPYTALTGVVFTQVFALTLKILNDIFSRNNGEGLGRMEALSRCWMMAADSAFCYLCIFMVKGWGTLYILLSDSDLNYLIFALLTILGRYGWTLYAWSVRHEDVYHMFEGVTGGLEIGITFFKYFWFLVWYKQAGRLREGGRDQRSLNFMVFRNSLFYLSSGIFFVRPMSLMMIRLYKHVDRHFMAIFCVCSSNFLGCVVMMWALDSKNLAYKKASYSVKAAEEAGVVSGGRARGARNGSGWAVDEEARPVMRQRRDIELT